MMVIFATIARLLKRVNLKPMYMNMLSRLPMDASMQSQ